MTTRRIVATMMCVLAAACSDPEGPEGEGSVASVAIAAGDAQSGSIGADLPIAISVVVTDSRRAILAGVPVTFEVTTGSGSVSSASTITNAAGVASTTWKLGTTIGQQTLRARATSVGTSAEVMFAATALPGAPAFLAILSGTSQRGDAGALLAEPLRVRLTDAFDNPISGATVSWLAQGGGSVAPAQSITGIDGRTETRWTLGAETIQQVVASSGSLQATFVGNTTPPGPLATLLVVSGDNQTGPAGAELGAPLAVRALDANGRPISGLLVVYQVTSGGGSFFGTTVTTAANGETRDRWTLGTSIGTLQRARARAVDPTTGVAREVLFSATPIAAAPAAITRVSGDQQSAIAGQALALPLVVRVTDAFGNRVSGAIVQWNASQGGGSISPLTSTTAADGSTQAQWTLGPSGTQAVQATVGNAQVTFQATAIIAPPGLTQLPDMPVPVRSAAVVVLNGKFHVLGGFSSGGHTDLHQIFDPATGTWTAGTRLPSALDIPAATVAADGIHLMGGSSNSGALNTHWVYNEATAAWIGAPQLPSARKGAVAWHEAGKIYLFGGLLGETLVATVHVYDVALRTWSTAASMTTPRYHSAVTVAGGEILVAGGATLNGAVSNLSAYNPSSDTWRELAPLAQARQGFGIGILGGRICFAGGNTQTKVWCRALTATTWDEIGLLLRPRFEMAAAMYNGQMFLFGGANGSGLTRFADRMGPFPN